MITALLLIGIVLDGIGLWLLLVSRKSKRETLELLRVVSEWVSHAKDIRRDAQVKADVVARKADQLAEAVQKVPQATADKVAEKIASGGSASDSDKFPAVRPPEKKR